MQFKPLRFAKAPQAEFFPTLRARVDAYFAENKISRHGNAPMVIKTIAMTLIYFVPLGLMLSGLFSHPAIMLLMWVIMGFGMAGIGMSVMHDANHGAYSSSGKVNKFVGYFIYLVGGNRINWTIQHNVLHHSFTNVDGMDEDINGGKILRFSPNTKRYKFHRFQHYYAFFLYGLMTVSWVTAKDFVSLVRYKKMGLTERYGGFKKLMFRAIFWKVLYYGMVLVLPLIFAPGPWWLIILGFLTMLYVSGFILSIIFQLAHVMPAAEFPLPDETGTLENNWAIHQVLTTSNFAPRSRILSWFVGGLNFQIEHHLFPNVCHVHYKKISEIVKKTTSEFGLPYHSQRNFLIAIWNHGKLLRGLGRA